MMQKKKYLGPIPSSFLDSSGKVMTTDPTTIAQPPEYPKKYYKINEVQNT